MSEELQVDGKPLSSLRVVDLREELKKRGIKGSGTKLQLQELLTAALESEKEHEARQNDIQLPASNEKVEALNEEHSNDSNATKDDSEDDSKIASLSFNEEKETIKLTIRSSPRKAEDSRKRESSSDSEDSQTESSESENSSSAQQESINNTSYTKNEELSQDSVKTDDSYNTSPVENGDSTNDNQVKDMVKPQLAGDDEVHETEEETKPTEDTKPSKIRDMVEEEPDHINDKSDDLNESSPLKNSQSETNDKPKEELDSSQGETVVDVKSRSSRRILVQSKSIEEKDGSKPVQKKRRWGGAQSSSPSASVLAQGISSDKLKQLINDSVEAENVKVSKPEEEVVLSVKLNEQPTESTIPDEEEVKKPEVVKESPKIETTFKSTENIVKPAVKEEEKEIVRAVSPARNPQSVVLFITGLVRPYTLMQLKKLLGATGAIDEEKFWIDKIKSKCYVTYATVEEAVATREALHNLKWPQSSPKNLCVEFATLEDIDRCLHPENYENLPAKPPVKTERKPEVEKHDSKPELNRGKYDLIRNESKEFEREDRKKEEPNQHARVREWDRDKLNRPVRDELKENEARKKPRHSPPPREPLRDKREKPDRRSNSPDENRREETNHRRESRSESPAKLLEDLFRKTKATPYIYWLPLTDEQAVEKEKQRVQIEKDREARIAANRREAAAAPSPRKRQASPPLRPFGRERPPPPKYQRRSPVAPMRRRPSSRSVSPRRRYSRSRSPDRRRFSPRRRR